MSANPEQRRAIETVQGSVLVLAGAGSGKTRVLTLRISHLIQNCGVSPKSILGLTFTNKAAAEMRHRLAQMVGKEDAKQVTLSTFHSFCMLLLRRDIDRLGYTRNFSLYDEKDIERLMGSIARDLLNHEGGVPSLSATHALISDAKSKGLAPEAIQDTTNQWHEGFTQDLYKRLQSSMRAYNAVDFDGMLTLTVELLEKFPEVLERYQEQYQYILIDEYQDTNPIQLRLATLLSAKHQNLFVVGDDDQSIYGWRGADVNNILRFNALTTIKLEQNYRSNNTILKAANAVIAHNKDRHQKVLWSERGEGFPIEIFHAPTEVEEAEALVCRLVALKQKYTLQWRDIAILYRSNAHSRQFELALMKHNWLTSDGRWERGVPYQIYGGTEFYERREVKDLIAYLRVIVNPQDEEAILRVINQPRRGVGDTTLDLLTNYNRSHGKSLWDVLCSATQGTLPEISITPKSLEGLKSFCSIIEEAKTRFQNGQMAETLRWLIEKLDYRRAIHEEVKSQQMRGYKWENVEELVNALAEFEQATPEASLADFIVSFPLQSNLDKLKQSKGNENKVNMMTIHSSKGLEFKACFLVCVEDHVMPHEKSLMETGIEEERRLMYVAITRAMDFLTISMAKQRKRQGKDCSSRPSRFLFDIPKELLKVTKWHEFDQC
jgi:superfamily I DNA/RNA helicase